MVAIDLGSNTLRCIEFDGATWGKSFEKIVRTAEALHDTQRITDQAIDRIIDAIYEAQNIIDFERKDIVAYTTAAMRMAENSKSALDKIYRATGILFSVIDAEKEAQLTLYAVIYRMERLKCQAENFILVDIGGGSTELTHYCSGVSKSLSLDIGIVTLSESCPNKSMLDEKIALFQSKILESFNNVANVLLVLSAGTPTTIAAYLLGMDYKHYDAEKVNGFRLTSTQCSHVYDELLGMDENERIRFVGVGREQLIIAGIMMVQSLYDPFMCTEAIVIDDGLREGIALEHFRSLSV